MCPGRRPIAARRASPFERSRDPRGAHRPRLASAGWGVVEGSRIRREFAITPGRIEVHGRRAKSHQADYVLIYRNTKLAVVEAKAWDEPLTKGLAQAKDYAAKLSIRTAYCTNGQGVYGVDMTTGREGGVERYPTPGELWATTFAEENAWRDRFAAVPFEDKGGSHPSRYYQDIAVDRVMDAIARDQQRILLTLATGTGKTFIAFQIAWKLFHSRWNLSREPLRRPRILFLADRNILADQAYNAFSAFPEDALVRIAPADIRKKGQVPKNGSLFFTIFQTFMSGTGADGKPSPYFGDYPPDFFDFIVIDECHRGGANDESNWRDILDYFAPAVQLGLTATPKREDNIDTYKYFGDPVYIYSLKDGINDGFLTPFKVRQISTTLDDYVYTPDDKLIEGEIEAGRRYAEGDFNKIIEIKEREAGRVKIFMDAINQNEKTLVFCATQDHALAVRDLINQMKTSKDPSYCQRVTADDGELGEQHLRTFQDNEKLVPTILTTSQKLSTGVDARNIRNIVLMRLINSMIEFKQIIGRGTTPPSTGRERPPIDGGYGPRPAKIRVKLADGKARSIQHMMCTTFWHPDGTPMSAQQFMEMLFGKLPTFFKNETELRALWERSRDTEETARGTGRQWFWFRSTGRNAEDHRRGEERHLRRARPCRVCAAADYARGARVVRQDRDFG